MDQQTRIVEIVRRLAGNSISPTSEQSLFESGLLDSFTLPDLVTALEAEFAIHIPDSDLTPLKFDSISRIEAYILARS